MLSERTGLIGVVLRRVSFPQTACSVASAQCLKALVEAIVAKNIDLQYSQVMHHLRCKLSICLLQWSITCLQGCHASFRKQRTNFLVECHLAAPVQFLVSCLCLFRLCVCLFWPPFLSCIFFYSYLLLFCSSFFVCILQFLSLVCM